MDKYAQASALLLDIKNEMVRLFMWESSTPSPEALSSQQPFCCDTLTFSQWIQFIFIPRMQAMIDAKAALPASIAICPMAEESFKHMGADVIPLIDKIAEFDFLLSGKNTRNTGV